MKNKKVIQAIDNMNRRILFISLIFFILGILNVNFLIGSMVGGLLILFLEFVRYRAEKSSHNNTGEKDE